MVKKLMISYQKVKWMFRFVKPYQCRWILGFLFDVIGDGVAMYCCALGLEKMAEGLMNKQYQSFLEGGIYLALNFLFMLVFHTLFHATYGVAAAGIKAGMSGSIFNKMLKQPMAIDNTQQISEQMTYLNQDINMSSDFFTENLKAFVKAVSMGIIVVGSIAVRNKGLGVFCFLVFLGNVLGNIYFSPKQEAMAVNRQVAIERLNSVYNDAFSGAMVIKLFRLKSMMLKRIHEVAGRVNEAKGKERSLTLKQTACTNMFLYINSVMPLVIGAYLWATGRMGIGTIFFVTQMMDTYQYYCNSLGISIISMSKSQAGISRIYAMLQQKDEVEYYGVKTTTRLDGDAIVELKHLKVGYDKKMVVEDVSVKICPNETVAVVGSSGSGKSTIMKAILQFVPYQGSMKLYGHEARDYSLEFLRNNFAYVEQEAKLFDGSIYDNILFGNITATEDEVCDAAKKAFAHEFILKLPNGYDTIIGENGYKLSGGERQRLAIARAFLKNAPILLLDEATSALDSESEKKVQMAIEELMKGRTILVVAHRLSTIQHADRILVLEQGRIIESGNHNGLIEQAGRYKELYDLQFTK